MPTYNFAILEKGKVFSNNGKGKSEQIRVVVQVSCMAGQRRAMQRPVSFHAQDQREQEEISRFDKWLDFWLARMATNGKVVASQEEAVRGLLELEGIISKQIILNKRAKPGLIVPTKKESN